MKKLLLKILQNSHETLLLESLFNKVASLELKFIDEETLV